MKEYIRNSGFFVNLGASYKIDLMRTPPSTDYPAHAFRCPKEPLQPDLKVKRSFDFLHRTVAFTCC